VGGSADALLIGTRSPALNVTFPRFRDVEFAPNRGPPVSRRIDNGRSRAGREGGAFMLSPRVKLALVTLASLVVAAVVGGNGWSV